MMKREQLQALAVALVLRYQRKQKKMKRKPRYWVSDLLQQGEIEGV